MNTTKRTFLKCLAIVFAVFAFGACAGGPRAPSPIVQPDWYPSVDFSEVVDKDWKLTAVQGANSLDAPAFSETAFSQAAFSRKELEALDMADAYTLRFNAGDGRISGKGAPNRYFAPYTQEGRELSIERVGGTLMASFKEPESLKEGEFFQYLAQTKTWDAVKNRLHLITLNDQGEETTLIFEAEEP
jgi:heat shock protein HslJ